MPNQVNIAEKLATFSDHWNPRIIARYNGSEVRIAKVLGDFTFHSHAETDELCLVLEGTLGIEFRDRTVHLERGEMIVVPKGTEHRPFAASECHLLLMDREGEPNTGQQPSAFTRSSLASI